jgi:type I restriction enzyme S subunit
MDLDRRNLPSDWIVAKLGSVGEVRYGLGQPPEQTDDGVPMIRATNVKRGRISAEGLIRIKREAIPKSRNAFLKAGDIIVVRSGAYTGDVAMITKDWAGSVAGYDLVLSLWEQIDPAFCSFNILGDAVQTYFRSQSARSAQPHLNRHQLESTEIPLPSLPEQQKIAGVLGVVQRAIEQQERLLALTAELKKALLHNLFTEGLRGESQKPTEIGPVPKSWELVPCQDLCEMITVGVVVKPASHYVEKGIPAFRSFNVREDHLVPYDLVYFSETANETTLAKSKLRSGDVLVVRTGYPGTSCVVPKEYDGANCIDLVIVRPKAGMIRNGFLSRFFNAPAGKSQAVAAKHGLAQQHLNVGAVKRTLVPVPSLEEQDEIDSALATVQRKIALNTAKKETLTALFRTLLQQFMTAQIRVDGVDLPDMEIPVEEAVRKAEQEFEKYRQRQLAEPSQVEKDFEKAVKKLPKPKKGH